MNGAAGVTAFETGVNRLFAWLFRHWVALVSLWALATVGGAVLTPWLAARGFGDIAQALYWAYRPLCPQRPGHSFFINGYKMAFEQRETAIFLAAAAAGPLYALLRLDRWHAPGRLAIVSLIPMLVDVATQTAGLRAGDPAWRVATGVVAVFGVAAWAYPRFDADLRRGRSAIGPATQR